MAMSNPAVLPWYRRALTAIAKAKAAEPLEFEQIIFRYLIGAIITFYLIFSYAFEGLYQRSGLLSAVIMTTAWISAIWILVHLSLWPQRYVLRRTVSILTDAITVSLIIGYGEETAVAFFPVYLWVILGNGFRFGATYLYAAVVANTGSFLVMVAVTPHWQENWRFSLGLAVALVAVPLYTAKLIRNLRQAKEEAEAASRAKTEFLSMMSHELRTPLTAIIGLANISKVTATTAKERFSAVSTELAAGRLLRMLDTILNFQRIQSGAVERGDRPFDMLDILNELRAIVEPLAQRKGLEFTIRFTSGLPPSLVSDPDHIETIIVNLATNAVKYTLQGSVTLEVGLVQRGGSSVLRIGVRDTGIGIPLPAQSRIFDRFVRAQDHNVATESGVGLGLATCRSLTEILGGRLDFESEPGAGSYFWAELPVRVGDSEIPRPADTSRVVVVEGATPQAVARFADGEVGERQLAAAIERNAEDLPRTVIVADPNALSEATRDALSDALTATGPHPALVLTRHDSATTGNLELAATAIAAAADEPGLAGLIGTVARWHRRIAEEFSAPPAQTLPSINPLSILVADDNSLNRQVVSRMFMIDGHEPILAETGDEALEHLLDGAVDVAFLDVNMPGMSGIEVAQAYRTGLGSAATIPMIALTADISPETRQACLQAGMTDVLVKPVGLGQLRDALSRYVLGKASGGAGSEAAEAPAADQERLASLRELFGRPGFESHFLGSFERDLLSSLEKTAWAVREQNPQAVREALHSVKSSASTAGARRIIEEVERFQKEGSPLDGLNEFDERVRAAFNDYRSAARAAPHLDHAEEVYARPVPLRISNA
jgi:two-component system sensor histidine kinase RpfC